ncbi:MAG: ABC transporter permease, partial [Planctomycetota bacterium]
MGGLSWVAVVALAAGALASFAMLAAAGIALWKARSLLHKEFFSYFLSPIAYAVLVVFLGVQGWLVAGTLDLLIASGPRGVEWPLQHWLSSPVFWLVFLAACPLLTMRTFAEEKASGTLEMLMTSPLSDWQVVLAKYAGCLLFYMVLWLPTVVYLPILAGVSFGWTGLSGTTDLAPVFTTYLGLFLAGAMFLAMGVCVSSMVRDQLVAAQASLALGVVFLAGSFAANAMDGGTGYQLAYYLSVPLHFDRA